MRLINIHTLESHEFWGSQNPPYAILSHRWNDDEVSYKDFVKRRNTDGKGFQKVLQACKVASNYKVEWLWVDTCCIDRRSSAELSEAINSMFIWYEKAQICIAHLADVEAGPSLKNALAISAWFTRGWTLQELVAPNDVDFYDRGWVLVGSKRHFAPLIEEITGIDAAILKKEASISGQSIAKRMSWASNRQTTRAEDRAYSLMGIVGVAMPILYGEGENFAFRRLQRKIDEWSAHASKLSWDETKSSGSLGLKSAMVPAIRELSTGVSTAITLDSGYASLPNPSESSKTKEIGERESILSGASTVDYEHDHKQRMVIAFVLEMTDRLDASLTIDDSCSNHIEIVMSQMMIRFTTALRSSASDVSQQKVARFLRQQRG